MAVGRRKSRARTKQGRSHHEMTTATVSTCKNTGKRHYRHHIASDDSEGFGSSS